ncbi:MAG TPA: HAD-IB family phosphatase [Vicinamibacterales bacterium]|nr:HAD-IB family phosphatase [Vicinamibacterales bacterium]
MADPVTRPVVFLDFDGTITRQDATDALLEAFADPRWLDVETAWKNGRIGSRECLTAQMALVDATRGDVDAVLDGIEVDGSLVPLIAACAARRVRVHIVSDGFDYCIRRILSRPALRLAPYLERVEIVSSHLDSTGRRWTASFPFAAASCVHGCGTCKPAAMARLNPEGRPTIFVGDGLSDRFAAACATRVFAKNALAAYCAEQRIAYTFYDNLGEIAAQLDQEKVTL